MERLGELAGAMKRATLVLTLAVTVGVAHASPASSYSRFGTYEADGYYPRNWHSAAPLVDGIPLINYGKFKARNPVSTAQWGLANYSLWVRYRTATRWRTALRAANWLVRTQTPSGIWRYSFKFAIHSTIGPTQELRRGWGSALAQGQAISLLIRVYHHTHRSTYLQAARSALASLRTPVARGGFERRYHGSLYFEEYPTTLPNVSLNGDLQTLIGLYDASGLLPGAGSLFRTGASDVARQLDLFDSHKGFAYYSLAYRIYDPGPGYDQIVRKQLRLLAAITSRSIFADYAALWRAN